MKIFTNRIPAIAQGDVLIIRRGKIALPSGLLEVNHEGGRVICAHSETGHHHAIDVASANPAVTLFRVPTDENTMFLRINRCIEESDQAADVVHHRPWDTHETLRLLSDEPGTIYEIKRQREPTPEGWRQVQD